jgi:hypothetical protein
MHRYFVIPGRSLSGEIDYVNFVAERANPESSSAHCSGFRVRTIGPRFARTHWRAPE